MTAAASLDFLLLFLCIVSACMGGVLWRSLRRLNARVLAIEETPPLPPSPPPVAAADSPETVDTARPARDILEMLAPLVGEARDAARNFDRQIREKRELTKTLNEALDSRIISINLLLSRAETLHQKLEARQNNFVAPRDPLPIRETDVLDQQQQIIDLYLQQVDVDTIAQRLAIPRGEVQLVIGLKEKFMAMEQAP